MVREKCYNKIDMKMEINERFNGKTVFDVLRKHLSLSNRMLTKLKQRENGILLNGVRVTVRAVVYCGDELELHDEDGEAEKNPYLRPVELPFSILYEDAAVTVVDKPPHMPTHPSRDHMEDTLANALAYHYRAWNCYVFRPVNRLDRNTSGIVLTANHQLAASKLAASLQSGQIEKRYFAILEGELQSDGGVIRNYILREGNSIVKRRQTETPEPGADEAVTEYRVRYRGNGMTVVEASPITGRTHQLRVHFAGLGHPIVGDDLYGQLSPYIERQALHACSLRFPHPVTGAPLLLTSPLPSDMVQLLTVKEIQL